MGCVSSSGIVPLDDITISIFGIDNAGKTCLLRSLAGDFNFDVVPTVGLGQESFKYNDEIKLTVYDLGGSSNFRSIWTKFFPEIWGFIYVIDAADPERFEESKKTLDNMLAHKYMKKKPYIVIANKQDKEGAVPAEQLRSKLKIGRKVPVYDAVITDSKEGKMNEGVTQAIDTLVGEIVKNFEVLVKKREADMEEYKAEEDKAREEKLARIQARREQEEKEAKEKEESKDKNEDQKDEGEKSEKSTELSSSSKQE